MKLDVAEREEKREEKAGYTRGIASQELGGLVLITRSSPHFLSCCWASQSR